ncbi:EFR1 family ferrodoxin [candidate division KSB1 bacterium]|nr:EFR1 family ferrodoxin [candidate division KSB1 bacterium]
MAATIYYFTGTGNSLYVAKKLGEKMDNSKLISIAIAIQQNDIELSETAGIVCPIYMHNIPLIVVDFIKKLKQPNYFFIVFAGGGELGGCLNETKKLCDSQQLELSSLFNIKMPSNYTPYGCPSESEQQKDFNDANAKIDEIAQVINSQEKVIEKNNTGFIRTYIHPGLLYKLGYKYINVMDKSYLADENCNGCAICQKVCPVNNITIEAGKPVWHSHCQQCYACLQWCPKEAIQFGDKTIGIQRYHNPFVKVNEIIKSTK